MAKMRAYQLLEVGSESGERGVTGWAEVDVPECGEYDAILRPVAVASCTSDVENIRSPYARHPATIGHEHMGVVVEVGAKVKDFKPGDRVVASGQDVDPRNYKIMDTMPKLVLNPLQQGSGRSWAEKFLIRDADFNLAHVPDSVTNLQAVFVNDMMSTGFEAVRKANVSFGDSVAVIGIGPVGLMAVAGAALQGAGRIYAVGHRKACVDLAYHYGATQVIDYREEGDVMDKILEANGGPVDAAIICGGHDPEIVGRAVRIVKRGGYVSNIAAFLDPTKDFVIKNSDFYFGCNDVRITGGNVAHGRAWHERLLAIVEAGRVDPSLLATHRC